MWMSEPAGPWTRTAFFPGKLHVAVKLTSRDLEVGKDLQTFPPIIYELPSSFENTTERFYVNNEIHYSGRSNENGMGETHVGLTAFPICGNPAARDPGLCRLGSSTKVKRKPFFTKSKRLREILILFLFPFKPNHLLLSLQMAAVEATGVALAHRGALLGHAAAQMLFPCSAAGRRGPHWKSCRTRRRDPLLLPFTFLTFSLLSIILSGC